MTEGEKIRHDTDRRWVSVVSSVLVGWNVGLLVAVLAAIGLGVILRGFVHISVGGSSFYIVSGLSFVLGIVIGAIVGKKLVTWFSRRTRFSAYIWLVLLILFSAISFPASFFFIAT